MWRAHTHTLGHTHCFHQPMDGRRGRWWTALKTLGGKLVFDQGWIKNEKKVSTSGMYGLITKYKTHIFPRLAFYKWCLCWRHGHKENQITLHSPLRATNNTGRTAICFPRLLRLLQCSPFPLLGILTPTRTGGRSSVSYRWLRGNTSLSSSCFSCAIVVVPCVCQKLRFKTTRIS